MAKVLSYISKFISVTVGLPNLVNFSTGHRASCNNKDYKESIETTKKIHLNRYFQEDFGMHVARTANILHLVCCISQFLRKFWHANRNVTKLWSLWQQTRILKQKIIYLSYFLVMLAFFIGWNGVSSCECGG